MREVRSAKLSRVSKGLRARNSLISRFISLPRNNGRFSTLFSYGLASPVAVNNQEFTVENVTFFTQNGGRPSNWPDFHPSLHQYGAYSQEYSPTIGQLNRLVKVFCIVRGPNAVH